jgi:hypothetical protein
LTGAGIEQTDRLVYTATGQKPAIGAEADGKDGVGVSPQGLKSLAGVRIKQAHRVITTAAGQQLSIGAKADGPDNIGMIPDHLQRVA